jgi:hypothetical protein
MQQDSTLLCMQLSWIDVELCLNRDILRDSSALVAASRSMMMQLFVFAQGFPTVLSKTPVMSSKQHGNAPSTAACKKKQQVTHLNQRVNPSDLTTGSSATGTLHGINQTPADWCSKRQLTVVETAAPGSELFTAGRTGSDGTSC